MCAAPKGNQFWKLRSKHGRDKLFDSPELLWQAACEYFQWCDENPLLEVKAFNTKDQGIVDHHIAKVRAYTLQGLCLYLDCNTAYFRQFKKSLTDQQQDFSTVITRVEETIYNQKFQAAAADLLNANIIARDLGLANKQEIEQSNTNKDVPATEEELNAELDAIYEKRKRIEDAKKRKTKPSRKKKGS